MRLEGQKSSRPDDEMGRISTRVSISNPADPSKRFQCYALVDTGSAGMVLPAAWKERLGPLPLASPVQMETADQRVVTAEVCGPVIIQIEGFRPVSAEVTFLDMVPKNGGYEPLLGYIILQQSQAAVDMARDRLIPVKYVDLKLFAARDHWSFAHPSNSSAAALISGASAGRMNPASTAASVASLTAET